MGYRPPSKIYRLVFEDDDKAGLEVRAKSPSVDALLGLIALADKAGDADLAAIAGLFKGFARYLDGWNVEDDTGRAVPATYEGLVGLDADLAIAMVMAWIEAVSQVAPPLPKASSSGGTSLEASLPMEPASLSRVS